MDQYYLSDTNQKFQMAQHFHSSLDQPNLQNVQAKLYAARQRNHQLAMQYFQNKYGSTASYQQFANTHNLGEIKNNQQTENLKQHLQRKAREIQMKGRKKLRMGSNYKQEDDEQNIREEEQQQQYPFSSHAKNNNNRKTNSKRNNPWVNKNSNNNNDNNKHKNNHTSQLSLGLTHNVLVDTLNNNHQTQFIGQFKNYLINRKNNNNTMANTSNLNNSNINNIMQNNINLSQSNYNYNNNLSSVSKNQSKLRPNIPTQTTKNKTKLYQQQLAKKIYKEIAGQSKDNTKIQKLTLLEYLLKNKKIIRVLGFNQKQINDKLIRQYQTKLPNQITFQQFLFFILISVGKQQEIKSIKQQKRQRNIPDGCLLDRNTILHFQQVFKQLDKHTDLIVKRVEFIGNLANDPIIKKIINSPAVYQDKIDKHVTLRRIFQRLKMQTIFGTEEQKTVKQYISWNQFLNYFQSGSYDRSKYDLMLLVQSLKRQEKFGLMQLPDMVMEIIMEALKKTDRGKQYFNIINLIEEISRNPEFDHQKYSLARQQSKLSNLPSETFEEVLIRMKGKAPKYLTIKQFMQYFSARGKPIEQLNENRVEASQRNFSGVKVKFAGQAFQNRKENIDGYDSDPQMYSSKVMVNNSARRTNSKSIKKIGDQQGRSQFMQRQDIQDAKIMKKQFKVTIPVPFSFEERQKSRVKKQVSVASDMNFDQFRAQPIPAKVKDQSLYSRMLEEDRIRIQERRKNNMIITLANEKPFSFIDRGTKKKNKQQREKFEFKAKPIPWFCSVDLLDKKKEGQMVRNEKIAKQAQESLAKAKLPPRMQRDYQEKLAKGLHDTQNSLIKQKRNASYRPPPNFDKLHKNFEQGMQRKRKQNKVTQPQQFNLSKRTQSRPKTAVNFNSSLNFIAQQIKPSESSYKKFLQPKVAANSTLKYNQQVEKRRKEMQQKRQKQQKIKKQQEQRMKIDEELQKKVHSLAQRKQLDLKKQQEKRNKQMEDQQKNHRQWKKQRVQKGRQQPMLVQRPLKRDEKIQKMKKLSQISKTLKQNGIKGKDHNSYFNREELLLLQDWQVLKDKIK